MTTTEQTFKIQELAIDASEYAGIFKGIEPPVKTLYICSNNLEDLLARKRVAIVGTRKVTPYGRGVTEQFAAELARQGIVIVSGLAYGVDQIAHQAALDAGGQAIAVLPGSLARIYPSRHTNMARRIVEQGGALISEYPVGSDIAYKSQFVERNRIVSGISDILLITEASANSGTMHTANFAIGQGRTVFSVPGNITSPSSQGTNNILREKAHPALSPDDIIHALNLTPRTQRETITGSTAQERQVIMLLRLGTRDGEQLLRRSKLDVREFNQTLTMMELTGKIRALGANQWALR